jgi:hypothetical protein
VATNHRGSHLVPGILLRVIYKSEAACTIRGRRMLTAEDWKAEADKADNKRLTR